jgi:hypothetical protein
MNFRMSDWTPPPWIEIDPTAHLVERLDKVNFPPAREQDMQITCGPSFHIPKKVTKLASLFMFLRALIQGIDNDEGMLVIDDHMFHYRK